MWLRSREARATSAACRLTVTGLSVQATRPRALDNRADLPNGRQPAAPASSEWFSRLLVSLRPAVNCRRFLPIGLPQEEWQASCLCHPRHLSQMSRAGGSWHALWPALGSSSRSSAP